jgi:hypothetical protein
MAVAQQGEMEDWSERSAVALTALAGWLVGLAQQRGLGVPHADPYHRPPWHQRGCVEAAADALMTLTIVAHWSKLEYARAANATLLACIPPGGHMSPQWRCSMSSNLQQNSAARFVCTVSEIESEVLPQSSVDANAAQPIALLPPE